MVIWGEKKRRRKKTNYCCLLEQCKKIGTYSYFYRMLRNEENEKGKSYGICVCNCCFSRKSFSNKCLYFLPFSRGFLLTSLSPVHRVSVKRRCVLHGDRLCNHVWEVFILFIKNFDVLTRSHSEDELRMVTHWIFEFEEIIRSKKRNSIAGITLMR